MRRYAGTDNLRIRPGRTDGDLEAFLAQHVGKGVAERLVVLNNEHQRHARPSLPAPFPTVPVWFLDTRRRHPDGLRPTPGPVVQYPHNGGLAQASDPLDVREAHPRRRGLPYGFIAVSTFPVAQLVGGTILLRPAAHAANATALGGTALPRISFKLSHNRAVARAAGAGASWRGRASSRTSVQIALGLSQLPGDREGLNGGYSRQRRPQRAGPGAS